MVDKNCTENQDNCKEMHTKVVSECKSSSAAEDTVTSSAEVTSARNDVTQTEVNASNAKLKYRWKSSRELPKHVLVAHLRVPYSQVRVNCTSI